MPTAFILARRNRIDFALFDEAGQNPTKDFGRKKCGINACGIYTCKAKFNEFRLCLALAASALRCATFLSEGGIYVGRRLGAAARCSHIFRRERGDQWRREQAPALRDRLAREGRLTAGASPRPTRKIFNKENFSVGNRYKCPRHLYLQDEIEQISLFSMKQAKIQQRILGEKSAV